MTTLLSYKNDPALKEMLVDETVKHRKADQIIQGTYGTTQDGKFRGCAVGCAIHTLNEKLGKKYSTSDHSVYETELGIPEWLARLEDTIFEGLPKAKAKKWPEQFVTAVPVGKNLEPIKWQFSTFILKENIERVLTLEIEDSLKEQVVKSIQGVLAVHETAIKTGKWDEEAARSAESAARYAARYAAESAAESAARSAARYAAESAAWSAAESAAYERYAKELLRLLKKA